MSVLYFSGNFKFRSNIELWMIRIRPFLGYYLTGKSSTISPVKASHLFFVCVLIFSVTNRGKFCVSLDRIVGFLTFSLTPCPPLCIFFVWGKNIVTNPSVKRCVSTTVGWIFPFFFSRYVCVSCAGLFQYIGLKAWMWRLKWLKFVFIRG